MRQNVEPGRWRVNVEHGNMTSYLNKFFGKDDLIPDIPQNSMNACMYIYRSIELEHLENMISIDE